MSLYVFSVAALTFVFIGLMTPQALAQTLSPLTQDQDGDGDPLNEEFDIRADCYVDQELIKRLSDPTLIEPTLSEDDCNFVMHYLSGQCEEQTANGVNVTMVCDDNLAYYLESRNLLALLNEFEQKEALEVGARQQEEAREEANKPSWAEGLE